MIPSVIIRFCKIGDVRYILTRGDRDHYVQEWQPNLTFPVLFSGTREECEAWIRAKQEEVGADVPEGGDNLG